MSITIRNRRTDEVIYVAKGAADVRAAVEEAVENGANLRDAYLGGAYLGGANLRGANLRDANLRGAYFGGAKGIAPERYNDLLLLLDQVGKIRAYKLVTADLTSPIQTDTPITYEIGSTVEADANTNPDHDCGAGINLATLPWCLEEHSPGQRILLMEFTAKDIAAIPHSGGKFRVHKAKVIREVDVEAILAKEAEA